MADLSGLAAFGSAIYPGVVQGQTNQAVSQQQQEAAKQAQMRTQEIASDVASDVSYANSLAALSTVFNTPPGNPPPQGAGQASQPSAPPPQPPPQGAPPQAMPPQGAAPGVVPPTPPGQMQPMPATATGQPVAPPGGTFGASAPGGPVAGPPPQAQPQRPPMPPQAAPRPQGAPPGGGPPPQGAQQPNPQQIVALAKQKAAQAEQQTAQATAPAQGQMSMQQLVALVNKANPGLVQKNPSAFAKTVERMQKFLSEDGKTELAQQKMSMEYDAKIQKIQADADAKARTAQTQEQVAEIKAAAAQQVADIRGAQAAALQSQKGDQATTLQEIKGTQAEKRLGMTLDSKERIADAVESVKRELGAGKIANDATKIKNTQWYQTRMTQLKELGLSDAARKAQMDDETKIVLESMRDKAAQERTDTTADSRERVATLTAQAKKDLAAGKDLSDDQVQKIAEVRSRGDTSIMQLGMSQGQRGKVLALATDLAKQRGTTLDAADAAYRGETAGAGVVGRTAGSVAVGANEIAPLGPKIMEVAKRLNTSQYPTVNAIENAAKKGTGNADVVTLNSYIQTLKNAYQQIAARGGRLSVHGQEMADKLADGSMPVNQLNAAVEAMKTEAGIVKGATAGAMRDVTGGGSAPAPAEAGGDEDTIKSSLEAHGQTYAPDKFDYRIGPNGQVQAKPKAAGGQGASPFDKSPRVLPKQGVLPGELHLNNNLAPTVPKGTPRPFAPGEWVQNANGSWSSEISTTVQMPDGKWSVVPTLWLVNGKPTRVSEDQAVDYAEQSKLPFKRFSSEAEAEKFSQAREDAWQKVQPEQASKIAPLWGAQ